MQFVTDRPEEFDFERWASAQYSNQSALRARYHDMYYQQHPEENPLQASSSPSQNSPATAAHCARTSTKLTSHQDHAQLRSDNGLSDTRVASRGKAKKSSAGRRPALVSKLRFTPVPTKRKPRKSERGTHANEADPTTDNPSLEETPTIEKNLNPTAALAKKWIQPKLSFALTQRTKSGAKSKRNAAKPLSTEVQVPKQPQEATSCSALEGSDQDPTGIIC